MEGGYRQIFEFPGKAKSDVWRNFGFYLSDDGYTLDKTRAICKYCRIGVRYTGNTTNLHTHYVNHHLKKDQVGVAQVMCFSENDQVITLSPQAVNDIVHIPPSMAAAHGPSSGKESPRASSLTYAIMEFIIDGMLPFTTIASQAFQNLIHTLDPKTDVPSRKHLEDFLLPQMYEEGRTKVLARLENQEHVTLTTDIWSSSERYLTITANYISRSWQLNSFMLQTVELPVDATAGYISETLKTQAANWRITCEPILVSGHETVLRSGGLLKWKHLPCFAETINAAAKKGLAQPEIQSMIVSARKLSRFFMSGVGDSLKQSLPSLNSLQVDDEDRWNSTFTMLEQIIRDMPSIQMAFQNPDLQKEDVRLFLFDSNNQKLCQELVDLLRPLNNASMLLCEQRMVTVSMILPVLKKLEITLLGGETDCPVIKECRNTIWKEIRSPYSSDNIRDILLVCSLLDPRYKELRYVEAVEREKARRLLYDAALRPFLTDFQIKQEVDSDDEYIQNIILGPPFSISNGSDVHGSSPSSEEPVKKRMKFKSPASKFENDWLSDVVGHKDDVPLDKMSPVEMVSSEIDRFMAEKQITSSTSLIWWYEREKIFPNISCLAKKYMCVMATSRPAEHIFLPDRDPVRVQRSCIPPKNLDAMIFLNKNHQNLKMTF
ncbi:E3 SUMO-protein ligase ZBED1-like [Haliotis rufescens]|uniref:E3 SUMO-protein ligase ZBED1-like n=1 Tax=Haliotis rufescens TaxID=6454 RepID=UPI001EB03D81|nr:E3 SUMO-protein ligase ZBED1-like [Haliotis rufescens]